MGVVNFNTEVEELFGTVVSGGFCIGCGACAVVERSPIDIKFDENGQLKASIFLADANSNYDAKVLSVCPFSNTAQNEDEIGQQLYGGLATKHDKLGYVIQNFAGHVLEGQFRDNGSSGGFGTWIAAKLLEKGLVDGIIHIQSTPPNNTQNQLFTYSISRNIEDVMSGAKSRYYPIEMSSVLIELRKAEGNFAIVGVPCFIKAIRLLQNQDVVLRERIKFCIGLVCGHLKSENFAKMFGWQNDIHPNNLTAINFRTKLTGGTANQYGVTVTGTVNGKEVTKVSPPVNTLFGTNWGWGFFKYRACDYCDDVVAETADITIGDAWLPKYLNDDKGTNIIIVRNKIILDLLYDARESNKIVLEDLPSDEVVKSQSSGFNHRREGLQYRLYLTDRKGIWRPKKRVLSDPNSLPEKGKQIIRLRIVLAELSHVAFKQAIDKGSFKVFVDLLSPHLKAYNKLYMPPLFIRGVNFLKKKLKIS